MPSAGTRAPSRRSPRRCQSCCQHARGRPAWTSSFPSSASSSPPCVRAFFASSPSSALARPHFPIPPLPASHRPHWHGPPRPGGGTAARARWSRGPPRQPRDRPLSRPPLACALPRLWPPRSPPAFARPPPPVGAPPAAAWEGEAPAAARLAFSSTRPPPRGGCVPTRSAACCPGRPCSPWWCPCARPPRGRSAEPRGGRGAPRRRPCGRRPRA
mmetsp:Transcript_9216/g.31421  ORF Transcript_9216/g.31421 Transcript_9216/m.31421 type:complete len:214 (-) Transcript_9216:128-769(-)